MVLDNVTRPLARAVAPTTVLGAEHLHRVEPPVIFAANHASHLDTPLLLTTLPVEFRHRTVVAAASDYFFDRTWKAVAWSFSLAAIPIERTKVNRRSADVAAELIEDRWNLVIFPEGGRSPDGWLQPFRGGAAYLARRTGRPVVPVYIHGTRHVIPKSAGGAQSGGAASDGGEPGRRRIRRSPVTVVFGQPLVPDDGEDARRFGARIERAVSVLADEVTTDWYTARLRDAAASGPGAAAGAAPASRGPDASAWRRAWALEPAPVSPTERARTGGTPVWPPD
jgi:1-acyl-sn-glycerol-3-phosphate acyltransferase